MSILKFILNYKPKHRHRFDSPIISMYNSFYSRYIIYECKCGKRKSYKVTAEFGQPFPIETNAIDTKTFNAIANGEDYEIVGRSVFIKIS